MAIAGEMRVTPANLRGWILVASGVLVAAIAAFLLYGRWEARRQGFDLPDGLSKTIQQSTAGFTYSESRGGHTIYTLHAAKAVQYKGDGHAELHDVSITLYSAQGAPANRIYGNAFDWDPVHGVARALGEVQIDFQQSATVSKPGDAPAQAQSPEDEGAGRNTVHIKTSGLIFNKKTGLASTPEKIEFRLAEAAGSATGASFDSQSGVVVLLSDVAFNSSAGGNPLTVRAHHAQYDRDSRLLYLLQEVTDYGDSHSSSDQATVSFRPDGSAYSVSAEGKVVLAGSDGQQVNTRKMRIDLGAKSEPQQAVVEGGVLYVADNPIRLLHGSASSGTMSFGPQMTIRHAQLRDAVSLVDEEKFAKHSSDTAKTRGEKPESTTRQLGATKVDIDFAPMAADAADRTPRPQKILAVGSARINVHELYTKRAPQDTTVQGDQLFATLNDGQALESLRATGHSSLVVVSSSGAKQSSTGDNLLLSFVSGEGKKADPSKASPAAKLQAALQTGNVTLTQEAAPASKAGVATAASADRAEYDAATEMVHLSGNPRIKEPTGEVDAAAIDVARLTGNADATGGVKATFRQVSGSPSLTLAGKGPVHVVADHAHLERAKDLTTFYGTAREQARLWQESDSIAAPVLELSRTEATLSARGENGEAAAVHAVFTSAPHSSKSGVPGGGAGRTASPSVVRLQSKNLVYEQNDHKAVFSGGVTAQTPNGVLHASAMDIYLSPAPAKQPGTASQQGSLDSSEVSRIVARGGVVLQQPGRKGTGDELNYTAQDGKFVLTGSPAAPPRMTDEARGAVTGAALIFNDRDDSVIVDGGSSRAATQTHVAR